MKILAVDPGTTESGWCLFEDGKVLDSGVYVNEVMIEQIKLSFMYDLLAIEMIASYGMPVGKEVFETCVWIGRFVQCSRTKHQMVYRKDVKLNLCGTPRAKDPHIRQAIIDKLGPVGTMKNKGPLYGVKSHAWAAVAVALTV